MKLQNRVNSSAPGIPAPPAIVGELLALRDDESQQAARILGLSEKYPQFCQRILHAINSEYYDLSEKITDVSDGLKKLGTERFFTLSIVQLIYQSCNQYKIKTLDTPAFWQDTVCRAVSARKISELVGLDSDWCFSAAFIQDIGFLMLFFGEPMKSLLWNEFRKRDPSARLSMEDNIFKTNHIEKTGEFLKKWNIFSDMQSAVSVHHTDEKNIDIELSSSINKDQYRVLQCADWMASVYTADDKSHVLNQCRQLLLSEFEIPSSQVESMLEEIPDEVEATANSLDIKISKKIDFSQVLHAANFRLNKDNINYQDLTLRLDQALTQRDRLANEINRELNLAREIQQSLLPKDKGENYPVHGINLSAKALSGDFFDYFEIENGDIYFNLGDVSGKGVNAALLMAKTSSLFRCLGKRISHPAKLMYEVNNELCETSIHGMFVTMVAGLYRPLTGEIRLVNAGNPPALLFLENGLCQEFEATAPPLGVMSHMQYTEYTFNLQQSSLYLYSDGVTEGYDDENEVLELSGLFKLIATMKEGLSASDKLKTIAGKFTNTKKPLRDDVTLLLLEA